MCNSWITFYECATMKGMKRFAIFALVFCFALNAVSLSANAFSCEMTAKPASSEEMNCHDAGDQEQKDDKTHCEDVCFCQHVMLGQQILKFEGVSVPISFEKENFLLLKEQVHNSNKIFPPFRPPIYNS